MDLSQRCRDGLRIICSTLSIEDSIYTMAYFVWVVSTAEGEHPGKEPHWHEYDVHPARARELRMKVLELVAANKKR